MHLRLLLRFLLLALGFALSTHGMLGWQEIHFDMSRMWTWGEDIGLHPVFIMIFGLALIPPTLWEIFILEISRDDDSDTPTS